MRSTTPSGSGVGVPGSAATGVGSVLGVVPGVVVVVVGVVPTATLDWEKTVADEQSMSTLIQSLTAPSDPGVCHRVMFATPRKFGSATN